VPALQASVHLMRHFDASVEVLCVIGPGGAQATGWVSWVPDPGVEAVLDAMEKQGNIRRKHARKSFDTVIRAERDKSAFDAEFIERRGEIESMVGAAGRLADLYVVANSVRRWEQPFLPILDACLRRTGQPIFVAPPTVQDTIAQHVAIAWTVSPFHAAGWSRSERRY